MGGINGVKRAAACRRCGGGISGPGRVHLCAGCSVEWKWCCACKRVRPKSAFCSPGGRSYQECYDPCHKARNNRRNRQPQAKRRYFICHLKRKFGISEEEAAALADIRDCAGCDLHVESFEAARKKLHVDHCHATGVVRGVLCVTCNHALPVLEDVAWEARLRAYLMGAA